jgi:hypothetical protein
MKNLLNLLMSLGLILMIVSCKKNQDVVDPTPDAPPGKPTTTGAVTPEGTPVGTAITATIGSAGGTIQSTDQRIRIVIPAGALTTNQTISLQPITNNCPAGAGQAFRLTPHGITFAKPAAITFQYNETDLNGTAPELIRIAYQTDKGSWLAPAVKSIDTTARTVTVQTTHFSDWGAFKSMFIYPANSILSPGENVHLRVFQSVDIEKYEDELVVPLPSLLPTKYIEKWTLRGEGTLTHMHNEGDYYAPGKIPATNPAAVAVFLNRSATIDGKVYKDLQLITNLFVAPEGISVQVNEGSWQTYPGGANINAAQNVVLGKIGAESASVTWKGAPTGIFRWTKGTDVAFNLLQGPMIYQHLYGNAIVSGGSLHVDNSDETWVVGTFTVQPAGWIRPSTPPDVMGTASIKGVLRMKRVQ